ncbi:hypothetical protein [Sphingomonas sp. Leaf25]|uniref:hypothetical protein n=1 Tax=Sphingomonas sp. Leaf25 TaxID=1735692 RepID=UPI000700B49A|nr:hypothetical protein [Sphingomonas sp. Leaf25]KQN03741.1 hypothetical protein ASE78_01260 [Sphingomonas sp. Leaf25]
MRKLLGIIVPLAILVGLTLAAYLLVNDPREARDAKASTAYRTAPIDNPTRDPLRKGQARLAHTLAPAPLDGLRFVAQPSLSDHAYAFQIAVHALGAPAKAVLVVTPRDGGRPRERYRFNVPRQEERAFFLLVDSLLPKLTRDNGMDVDGTPAALERIAGGQSRTWTTNLDNPEWQPINEAIRTLIRRHAPSEALPAESDWHEAAVRSPGRST